MNPYGRLHEFEDAAEVCRRGKTSDEFEARIVTADQNVIWAMFQFQIYTYRSAVPYYLVSCWDITERKKMENEIMLVTSAIICWKRSPMILSLIMM